MSVADFWNTAIPLAFIGTCLLLYAVSVIASGKFLVAAFTDSTIAWGVFKMAECFGGLTGAIIMLLVLALLGGEGFYKYAASHFGINPGQFFTLCFSSAIITVPLSGVLWLIFKFRPCRIRDSNRVDRLMVDIGRNVRN